MVRMLSVYSIFSCWCRIKRTGVSWTGLESFGDLSVFWKCDALVRSSETDHVYILHLETWKVCGFLDMAGLLHNLG